MPETKELNLHARELQVKDGITAIYDGDDVITGKKIAQLVADTPTIVYVERKDHKTQHVHLETSHGKLVLRQDANVLAAREVKTEAEKQVEAEAYTEELLDEFIKRQRQNAAYDPMARLIEKMDAYKNDIARGLSWYVEETMVSAHKQALAVGFLTWLEREQDKTTEDHVDGSDLPTLDDELKACRREVFLDFCKELDKRIVQKAKSMGGSTNAVSNLSDACELKALAEYLDDFSYGVAWLRARLVTAEA